MNAIVYAETWEGKFKKSTFEAVSYGARVAQTGGGTAIAVVFGKLQDDASALAKYGAAKVIHLGDASFDSFNNAHYAKALAETAKTQGADCIIVSGTNNGKMVAPATSVYADAALVTNVISLPETVSPLVVRKSAFSSKGLADFKSHAAKNVICIVPNAIGIVEVAAAGASEQVATASDASLNVAGIKSIDRVKGKIPLPEAELVVSAGRGMKAPENWKLIEELADTLGAATACSKPVSDIGWRPHSEHVGQTGIQINPNLYIAIGISGAIQHLAGVSASKTIVVINSDPEAPFFKAADYGIVGDAFEIVPKLTQEIQAFKAAN
jgi:electron transfer flavoprotein alpha subunit